MANHYIDKPERYPPEEDNGADVSSEEDRAKFFEGGPCENTFTWSEVEQMREIQNLKAESLRLALMYPTAFDGRTPEKSIQEASKYYEFLSS